MSKWKIFRLHAVMRFAHWLKVPVVPHQCYFDTERPIQLRRRYLRSRAIMFLARLIRIDIDVRNSYFDCPPCRPATPSSRP